MKKKNYKMTTPTNYTTEEKLQIANTILQQLGGRKFKAMTGAKEMYATDAGLRINKIPKNASKANKCEITLTVNDTYHVVFWHVGMKKGLEPFCNTVAEYNDVYEDMLQDIWTAVTGQYTKF